MLGGIDTYKHAQVTHTDTWTHTATQPHSHTATATATATATQPTSTLRTQYEHPHYPHNTHVASSSSGSAGALMLDDGRWVRPTSGRFDDGTRRNFLPWGRDTPCGPAECCPGRLGRRCSLGARRRRRRAVGASLFESKLWGCVVETRDPPRSRIDAVVQPRGRTTATQAHTTHTATHTATATVAESHAPADTLITVTPRGFTLVPQP